MKTILPWVVAVLAIGGAVFLFKSNQSKSTELAKLQSTAQEVETLRTEIAELKKQQVPPAEIAQLRKDKEDLLRLRNEVARLRNESQQLAKQAQSAQNALAGAQAETQRLQQQAHAASLHVQQQAQAQPITSVQTPEIQALNMCINNLRRIDAAKQNWALKNRKPEDAVPTPEDLAPDLKEGVTCPASGTYTINAIASPPTCNIPGHVLGTQ